MLTTNLSNSPHLLRRVSYCYYKVSSNVSLYYKFTFNNYTFNEFELFFFQYNSFITISNFYWCFFYLVLYLSIFEIILGMLIRIRKAI